MSRCDIQISRSGNFHANNDRRQTTDDSHVDKIYPLLCMGIQGTKHGSN